MEPTKTHLHVTIQEPPLNPSSTSSSPLSLVTTVALSALLALGIAIGTCMALAASCNLTIVAPACAALGAGIGIIIHIARNLFSKPPEIHREPHPEPRHSPRPHFPRKSSSQYLQSPYRRSGPIIPQGSPSKAPSAPIIPVKIKGIKLSEIHQMKLMSSPTTPGKHKKYECVIIYKDERQENHKFSQRQYDALLEYIPEKRRL